MKQTILASTFIRFRERLSKVAAGIVGNRGDAEDVLQDAFCRLWSTHSEIADEASAIKLSYVAVRNMAIDSLRHSRDIGAVQLESMPAEVEADSAGGAEDARAVCDAVMRIAQMKLKPLQYEVFRLHDAEGLTYPEVAEAVGQSQEYVRVALSRARKTIREIYRKQYASE